MTGTQDPGVVLVVDDEEMIRTYARFALESYGHTVLLADGGQSAIEVLRTHSARVDIVLLDMMMPKMTGEMVLPELIRLRPDLKVIISSGYCDLEHVKRSLGHLISSCLNKPYTPDQLAEHVRFALLDRVSDRASDRVSDSTESRPEVSETHFASRRGGDTRPPAMAARSAA